MRPNKNKQRSRGPQRSRSRQKAKTPQRSRGRQRSRGPPTQQRSPPFQQRSPPLRLQNEPLQQQPASLIMNEEYQSISNPERTMGDRLLDPLLKTIGGVAGVSSLLAFIYKYGENNQWDKKIENRLKVLINQAIQSPENQKAILNNVGLKYGDANHNNSVIIGELQKVISTPDGQKIVDDIIQRNLKTYTNSSTLDDLLQRKFGANNLNELKKSQGWIGTLLNPIERDVSEFKTDVSKFSEPYTDDTKEYLIKWFGALDKIHLILSDYVNDTGSYDRLDLLQKVSRYYKLVEKYKKQTDLTPEQINKLKKLTDLVEKIDKSRVETEIENIENKEYGYFGPFR